MHDEPSGGLIPGQTSNSLGLRKGLSGREHKAASQATNAEMRTVCAWCKAKIGGQGKVLSHGICDRCFSLMLQRQFDFMDDLPYFGERSRRARIANSRRV